MALTTHNSARETYRQAYSQYFMFLYAIRRHVHWYIAALAMLVPLVPAAWWLWAPMLFFLLAVDTDVKLSINDPFGRGKGPYFKKKAGKDSGEFESWTVVSTPQHRGGDGIWPLGNNIHTEEEIWASDDFVRTHAVLSGTTGSGKTVTMSSTFIYVAMISDSGVIMIDGKADPKTWFDLYALSVSSDRADDFLVLNFVVGQTQEAEFSVVADAEKELWEEFQSIESNTFNIFGTGTSDTLFEIGSSLLGAEASGDNKMWVERAEALLRSLLKALVDLRDQGQLKISIATIQEYMSLEKLSELENNPDISEMARQQVGAVLNEIAGYRDAMKIEDPGKRSQLLADQPSKQFAFLHMQFGALFAMLIGTYGHIANVEYSDIYAPDVIRNRRILLVMLPALEKAPTSLAQLGRMATSAIKSALSQNISGSLTGRKSELVDRRPTNSTRAMVLIYDEAASYIQAGTADVASQSRSLGAFNIFSSQEWGSFKNAGEIEAQRIISNTGLKIVLKNEDKETADHFMNAVGDARVLTSGGKRHENGKLVETEQRYENVPRITFQDMMNLAEGQGFIKWRSTLIHVRMPFVAPPSIKSAQRNDLIPIPGSMTNDRVKMRAKYAQAAEVAATGLEPLDLVATVARMFEEEPDKDTKPQYALFEKIIRNVYSHQIIIPWEEAAPPRGRVKATQLYTFKADRMAQDMMYAIHNPRSNPLIGRLQGIEDKPDDRFAIPLMPHEAGMVAKAYSDDPEVKAAREAIDQSLPVEEISKLLQYSDNTGAKTQNEDVGASKSTFVTDNYSITDSGTTPPQAQNYDIGTENEDSTEHELENDLEDDYAQLAADESAGDDGIEADVRSDVSSFLTGFQNLSGCTEKVESSDDSTNSSKSNHSKDEESEDGSVNLESESSASSSSGSTAPSQPTTAMPSSPIEQDDDSAAVWKALFADGIEPTDRRQETNHQVINESTSNVESHSKQDVSFKDILAAEQIIDDSGLIEDPNEDVSPLTASIVLTEEADDGEVYDDDNVPIVNGIDIDEEYELEVDYSPILDDQPLSTNYQEKIKQVIDSHQNVSLFGHRFDNEDIEPLNPIDDSFIDDEN